jgi:hypothetical protein
MVLVITKKHTIGTSYDSIRDCALSRAIKEKYPDMQVKSVFCDFFRDIEGNEYSFDTSEETGYCRRSFNKLKEGHRGDIVLTLSIGYSRKNLIRSAYTNA